MDEPTTITLSSASSGRSRPFTQAEFDAAFDAKVDRSGGPDACWPWTGATTGKSKTAGGGYGVVRRQRRLVYAHRVAFERVHGVTALCVLHDCDNTVCCNPKHLFDGTRADNNRDMIEKGRAWWQTK